MKIKELMTRDVLSCSADDNLNRAAQLMWENDCGVLPVIGTHGTVVGMITDRDICMSAYIKGRPLTALRVQEAMAKQVSSCSAEASLETAMFAMQEARVRRLPVVDDQGRLAGVLSMNDLAREARRQSKAPGGQRLCSSLAEALGAICESRRPTKESGPATKRAGELVGAIC